MDQQHCTYSTILRGKSVHNGIISIHASCLQQGTKVILQNVWQSNSLFVLNTKFYVWGKSNTTHCTTIHIFKHSGGCIMLWVCL